MKKRALLLLLLAPLTVGAGQAPEVRAVLQAASQAMGADKVKTLEYTSIECQGQECARVAIIGQEWTTGKVDPQGNDYNNWPHVRPTAYHRVIDYGAKASVREMSFTQGEYSAEGGGIREGRVVEYVNGDTTWDIRDNTPVPVFGHDGPYLLGSAPAYRQLEIWLTPHGFIKAALAVPDAKLIMRTEYANDGSSRELKLVAFTMGKYVINALINDDNLIENIATHVPEAMFGDMVHEYIFRNYADFNGVKFPRNIHSHSGNRFLSWAHDAFNITIGDVKVNETIPSLAVPAAVRGVTAPAERVATQQLANGVWLLGGASQNSVAVEFKDWVTVVEAPLNEARSLAVMAEIKRLVPNKPIRYVVNTHHHSDHAGGLRTYRTNGATIITSENNRWFYENIAFYPAPRTLEPDLMSLYPVRTTNEGSATFQYLSDERVGGVPGTQNFILSDRSRTMEIYTVRNAEHATGMLIAYLPNEKILINAELYSPPAEGAPPVTPTRDMRALRQLITNLKLDVERHVGIDGGVGSNQAFLAAFPPQAAPTAR